MWGPSGLPDALPAGENGRVTLLSSIADRDRDALKEILAEDVVFHSPVQTYRGREQVVHLFVLIGSVLERVDVTREVDGVTFFAAQVEEHPVDGVLDQRTGDDGRFIEVTLMLRPLAGLQAAVARMTRALAKP
jgi:SnoaL-like protein